MRIVHGLLLSVVTVVASSASAENDKTGAASSATGTTLLCNSPSLTRPVNQTVISLKDSYPPLSTVLGEEGDTELSFVIKENGTVTDVRVTRSSGFLRLDDAGVAAAKQLVYAPATSGGSPVACRHTLLIGWHLSDKPGSRDYLAIVSYAVPGQKAWPAGAFASAKQGVTGVSVMVDKAGRFITAAVGHPSGDIALDDAALAYVKTLKFGPAQVGGKAAGAEIPVVIIWSTKPVTLPPGGTLVGK